MTASPYLGLDSVEPFLAACRRHGAGVFFLVRTSNAGAADVQDLALSDGRPLWHHVAELVREWGEPLVGEGGMSSVGAVVGATHPRAVSEARRLLPQTPMLLPGVGAQGATPADVARAFTAGPASALVTASRSVIYAYRETEADWRAAAGGGGAAARDAGVGRRRLVSCEHVAASQWTCRAPVMRRALLAVVAVSLAVLVAPRSEASSADAQTAEPQIAAASWYLVGDDGSVLARSDAGRARAIASITKLMTAVVVLEHAELDDVVRVSPRAAGIGESTVYLRAGRGADGRGAPARDAHPERERRRRGARASRRAADLPIASSS